jgi:hypothetical protein
MGEKLIWTAVSDQELLAQVAKRGLTIPTAVGAVATGPEIEVPANLLAELLDSAVEGANLYLSAVNGINAKRDKRSQIPTLQPGEYRERAKDWLTDNLVTAAAHLPVAANYPRLVVPRLTRAITTEENVEAWSAASDQGLWPWNGRMKYLSNWIANQLSGFNPEADLDEVQFQVIPTAYDKAREGTVTEQSRRLETLRIEVPELHVSAIFDGAVIGRRYKDQPRRWQDTYVRAISLKPAKAGGYGCSPGARVYDNGSASLYDSGEWDGSAARLLARK